MLHKAFQKTKFSLPILDLAAAIQHLRQAYEAYNLIKRNAKQCRVDYLASLAEAIAEEDCLDIGNAYNQLKLREKVRKLSRKIKQLQGKQRSLIKVEVPSANGTWKETTTKEELESGCIDKNYPTAQHPSKSYSIPPSWYDPSTWMDREHSNCKCNTSRHSSTSPRS
jgi:hypothetical protein